VTKFFGFGQILHDSSGPSKKMGKKATRKTPTPNSNNSTELKNFENVLANKA